MQIFFFKGRLMFGPDAGSLVITLLLIVVPIVIFCTTVARNLLHEFPTYNPAYVILVVTILYTIYVSPADSFSALLTSAIALMFNFIVKTAMWAIWWIFVYNDVGMFPLACLIVSPSQYSFKKYFILLSIMLFLCPWCFYIWQQLNYNRTQSWTHDRYWCSCFSLQPVTQALFLEIHIHQRKRFATNLQPRQMLVGDTHLLHGYRAQKKCLSMVFLWKWSIAIHAWYIDHPVAHIALCVITV